MRSSFLSVIYLLALLISARPALSQQEYFNAQNKKQGLDYYKEKIYQGCSDLKEQQETVSPKEMERLILATQKIVEENFSQAFKENPLVRDAYVKDLKELSRDGSCQRLANDCRARLLGLSLYYYQQFRADLPDCEENPTDNRCALETKYRKISLQGARNNYGMLGPGSYKKELVAQKNNTTIKLFELVMHKDKVNLHICNEVQSGVVHQYFLKMDNEGEYYTNLDPSFNPNSKLLKACIDEKVMLFEEFVLTDFDHRSTIGSDQVEPIKSKISNFVKSNTEVIVTDITVVSSSAKMPFYTVVAGKKVIDAKSAEKNLAIANERSSYVDKALREIKSSSSTFGHIKISAKAEMAGPEFELMDLNDRFVTRMTPGYFQRVEAVFEKNNKTYKEQALVNSFEDLLDEKKYANLFQAKYKPFQGFKIVILGHRKSEMKCLEGTSPKSIKGSSSIQ